MAINPNYVKFQRGTSTAYNTVKQRNGIDPNTLYFIYDTGEDTGLLYLGEILIGGVGSGSQISNLSDLSDILLTNVGTNDILIRNSYGKWINKSISDIANLIAAESGLGFISDEKSIHLEPVESEGYLIELNGFSAAVAGMTPVKGTDGNLTWTNDLTTLNNKVTNLETAIENINSLQYQVVSELTDVIDSGIIYLVPKNEGKVNNGYNEYIVIDSKPELLGDLDIDLSGYATTSQLNNVASDLSNLSNSLANYVTQEIFDSTVGDITSLINYTSETPTTIVTELNNLSERLMWQEIKIE